MRCSTISAAGLSLTLAAGCDDGANTGTPTASPSGTPAAIERSIAEHCKTRVARGEFPGDPGHARFRALAEDTMLIRCEGHRADLSAYASFESHARLRTALGSIVLPPGRVEQFCVTDRVVFTTDFWGS